MEHNYLKTTVGKFHAVLVLPSMLVVFLAFCYEYSKGKTPFVWGLLVSVIGFLLFFKAKWSVIRTGKKISFGCDLMDQRNTNFYFTGWVLMISGYFLSFWSR